MCGIERGAVDCSVLYSKRVQGSILCGIVKGCSRAEVNDVRVEERCVGFAPPSA